ncbi:MAG: Ubiquinone/menaquinone biosynthesis C-methylase UbiE [Candidatus Methanohalarchaeum thermophilum]|uniref:Ubiquinone/menaquinone biosynthesis C-methylase UbiE n=1 Tax=Methanohalarchaeum thermophilum TaxID=1903181 RepID=A0A1Q6DXT4_METT1|nr:MAG: Ubiquinone/menaquinone biosynthesis C-methylase UbiE [Candidatus Methanohalarchaeum thermophilum]
MGYISFTKRNNLNWVYELENSQVNDLFTNIYTNYDTYKKIFTVGLSEIWENAVVNEIKSIEGKNILDLGTGTGSISFKIKNRFNKKIYGVDNNLNMLKIAKSRKKDINLVAADAGKLPFRDNFFDAVIISYIFRYYKSEKIRNYLEEISRVMKSGRNLIYLDFMVPNSFILKNIHKFYIKDFFNLIKKISPKKDLNQTLEFLTQDYKNFFQKKDIDELCELINDKDFKKTEYRKLTLQTAFIIKTQKK